MGYQTVDLVVVVYGNEWYPAILQEVIFQCLYNLFVKYQSTLWLLTVTEFLMIRPFHVFLKQCQSNFQVKDDIVVKCMDHLEITNYVGQQGTISTLTIGMMSFQYCWSHWFLPTVEETLKWMRLIIKWQTIKWNIDIKYNIYIIYEIEVNYFSFFRRFMQVLK